MRPHDRPRRQYWTIKGGDADAVRAAAERVDEWKQQGYWQGVYQGWFATALEYTKSVFTMSSAGVGLTFTLLFGQRLEGAPTWAIRWLLFSGIAFSLCSWFCVRVFMRNKEVLDALSHQCDSSPMEELVKRFAIAADLAFTLGIVFLVCAAIARITG